MQLRPLGPPKGSQEPTTIIDPGPPDNRKGHSELPGATQVPVSTHPITALQGTIWIPSYNSSPGVLRGSTPVGYLGGTLGGTPGDRLGASPRVSPPGTLEVPLGIHPSGPVWRHEAPTRPPKGSSRVPISTRFCVPSTQSE
jgi:hypothetical protein